MTYEELVGKVKSAYEGVDAGRIREHVAFQFNIEGEAAGAFYLEIADGKVFVEPFEYFDRDVLVTTSAATLLEIVGGQLDPVKAFLTGRIKAQGNLGKAAFLKELSAEKGTKSEEKKPGEKKSGDKKPEVISPVEKKLEEKEPEVISPVEKKPEEKKPEVISPVEKKSEDKKPVDKKSAAFLKRR